MLADIANDIWKNVKADSHELCLIHAAVADGCAPAEIGNFYFSTPHTSAAATHIKRSLSEWAFNISLHRDGHLPT